MDKQTIKNKIKSIIFSDFSTACSKFFDILLSPIVFLMWLFSHKKVIQVHEKVAYGYATQICMLYIYRFYKYACKSKLWILWSVLSLAFGFFLLFYVVFPLSYSAMSVMAWNGLLVSVLIIMFFIPFILPIPNYIGIYYIAIIWFVPSVAMILAAFLVWYFWQLKD